MPPRGIVVSLCLALALLAVPVRSDGQQAGKVWRIGFLVPQSRTGFVDGSYREFLSEMRDLGHAEGKDFIVEWRFADGQYERLPGLAAELVRLNVDVLIASGSPAIRAAQQATTTIPIVFPTTGDPVGSGFVASLARPGGNITGVSNENVTVSAKLLELLQEVKPKLARVALLGNPGSSTYLTQLKNIQADAQTVGVQVLSVEARTPEEIDRGFAGMPPKQVEAVMIAADSFLSQQRQQIAALALRHRLPSVTQQRSYAEAGGLMSYGNSGVENMRRTAAIVDKIFKGAKPADIPVEQPTKFQLFINLKTAKALGLTIPPSLLMRAVRVIE
jgi:putative ABC transport system substrate-binding protein